MKLLYVFPLIAHIAVSLPTSENTVIENANFEILKDERSFGDDGSYSFKFKTENNIERSESGTVREEGGPVVSQGEISYKLPNGETFYLTFVADENGYQPQSSFLPVAPAFPHPIPDFVQRQIEKAKREDEAREKDLEEGRRLMEEEEEGKVSEAEEQDKEQELSQTENNEEGKEEESKVSENNEKENETDNKPENSQQIRSSTKDDVEDNEVTTQTVEVLNILENKTLEAFLKVETDEKDETVDEVKEAFSASKDESHTQEMHLKTEETQKK